MFGALQEGGGEAPHGKLGWAIDEDFGSIEKLIKKMNAEGAALQGSGWVVCTLCTVSSALHIILSGEGALLIFTCLLCSG